MPRRRLSSPDHIEQDFLDALQRLKSGHPQNAKLREKVRRGKAIKINISTIAQEAGRARGLIAMENCRYPKVRQLIVIEMGTPGTEPRNRDDVIANLRAQVAELRVQLADAKSHAAYHFDFRTKAEKNASEYKGRYERLRKKVDNDTLARKGKVVPLFPDDGLIDGD